MLFTIIVPNRPVDKIFNTDAAYVGLVMQLLLKGDLEVMEHWSEIPQMLFTSLY